LINCASADQTIRANSIAGMRGEFERAMAIGAEYLVMHPGSAKDQSIDEAIVALAASLEKAAKGLKPKRLTLLLENTAGAGATLGRTFEELHQIRTALDSRLPCPVGYCLDTCHLYASGYDVLAKLPAVVREAEKTLGIDNVPVIHANDSKGALGSKLDRHMNIGEGLIGREGFRRILNHPKLRSKAFVLETPIDNEGDDRRNVETLWSLSRKTRST
jgi:deoxyribonuclease-4